MDGEKFVQDFLGVQGRASLGWRRATKRRRVADLLGVTRRSLTKRLQGRQCLLPVFRHALEGVRHVLVDRERRSKLVAEVRSSSSWFNVSSTPLVLPELMASSSASFEG